MEIIIPIIIFNILDVAPTIKLPITGTKLLISVIIYVIASPNLSVIKLMYSGCKFKLSNISLVTFVRSFRY